MLIVRPSLIPQEIWLSRCSLGLAFIMCGQPLAWAVRGELGIGSGGAIFPAIPIIVGLTLMLQPNWILRREFYSDLSLLTIPLLIMLAPFAAMSLINLQELYYSFAYPLCLCVLALLIGLNRTDVFSRLPQAMMLVGFASSITPIVQLATAGAGAHFVRLVVSGNENTLVVGSIGGMTVLAALVVGFAPVQQRVFAGMLAALAFAIGLAAVVLSDTRSVMLALAVCLPLYAFYLSHLVSSKTSGTKGRLNYFFFGPMLFLVILAPITFFYAFDPSVIRIFLAVTSGRFLGALGFFTDGAVVADSSSAVRWSLMVDNWNGLSPFGQGIMAQSLAQGQGMYPHLSYLQAFYDLGYVGGLAFLVVALLLPCTLIVLRLGKRPISSTDALIVLLFIFSQAESLLHATPYSWTTLLPAVLVYSLFSRPQEWDGIQHRAAPRIVSGAPDKV